GRTRASRAHRRPAAPAPPPSPRSRPGRAHRPDRRAPSHTAAVAYGTDPGFRRREAWRPMAADLDIITFGRSGVDIYPLEIEKGLEDNHGFGKFLGGSPMNVAVAAARLSHTPGVITGVGDDPFGRYVVKEMERLGVDSRFVVTNHEYNTPITLCEIFPPDDFPLYFYRQPTAPDLQVAPEHLDLEIG